MRNFHEHAEVVLHAFEKHGSGKAVFGEENACFSEYSHENSQFFQFFPCLCDHLFFRKNHNKIASNCQSENHTQRNIVILHDCPQHKNMKYSNTKNISPFVCTSYSLVSR